MTAQCRETALRLWKLLWDVFAFRSFAFAQGYLLFSCLALNGWFRAFSFRRLRYERCRLYASGLGAGGTGPGLDGAQSHGGRRDRKGRRGHRSGLARAIRRAPRGAERAGLLHGRPRRSAPCMSRWSPAATTESSRPVWRRFWKPASAGWWWAPPTQIRWWRERASRFCGPTAWR